MDRNFMGAGYQPPEQPDPLAKMRFNANLGRGAVSRYTPLWSPDALSTLEQVQTDALSRQHKALKDKLLPGPENTP